MADYKKYINALRKCAEEHENDSPSFGHIRVSDLCRDTADLLETLEQELSYNSAGSELKNPKANTFDVLDFIADNAGLSIREAIEKAYNIGVSEQQPVLDKIRVEIDQLPTKTRVNWDGCCPDIDYPVISYVDVTKDKLLSIIDKYK